MLRNQRPNDSRWTLPTLLFLLLHRHHHDSLPSPHSHHLLHHHHPQVFRRPWNHRVFQWPTPCSLPAIMPIRKRRQVNSSQKPNLQLPCPNLRLLCRYVYPTIPHKWHGTSMVKFYHYKSMSCLPSRKLRRIYHASISMVCQSTRFNSRIPMLDFTITTMPPWLL